MSPIVRRWLGTAIFIALLITGLVTIVSGYNYYTKIPPTVNSRRRTVHRLGLGFRAVIRWYLSPGDKIQLSLIGMKIIQRIRQTCFPYLGPTWYHSRASSDCGLLQSWNKVGCQWKSYPDHVLTLYFNATHYYEIQTSMYFNRVIRRALCYITPSYGVILQMLAKGNCFFIWHFPRGDIAPYTSYHIS